MKQPAELARELEENPALPPGEDERFSGYAVMGLPFRSGHVLSFRRWPASSVGEAYSAIWHRDPAGRWTFYQTAEPEFACTRYFGAQVDEVRKGPIELTWQGPRALHVRTSGGEVDWVIGLGATTVTQMMTMSGVAMPATAWRARSVLTAMGAVAGPLLRAGRVRLTGHVPNGHHFDVNPLRIWSVTSSRAIVGGSDLGPAGPLSEQARLADVYIPQRGLFAMVHTHLRMPPGGPARMSPAEGAAST